MKQRHDSSQDEVDKLEELGVSARLQIMDQNTASIRSSHVITSTAGSSLFPDLPGFGPAPKTMRKKSVGNPNVMSS